MPLPTKDQVTDRPRAVIDPELRRSIVDLGMVRSIEIADGGHVDVVVSLTTPGCPIRSHFQQAVVQRSPSSTESPRSGSASTCSPTRRRAARAGARPPLRLPEGALAQVKNVVCVASGKGGVGKSTMTANLAAALRREGHSIGVLDCDVYGYSIPRMLGVDGKPDVNAERKIIPIDGAAGIRVMSIGFFLEQNAAVVWRGPMLHKAIQQFLEDVDWGELDYLLLDLPPGHGRRLDDARAAPARGEGDRRHDASARGAGVARRAAEMAGKVDLELLGVIENMSGFTTPDGERFTIFGEGGGQLLADELEVPLLGKVPLSEELREHADTGVPLALDEPDSPAAQAVRARGARHRRRDAQELPVMQAEAPALPPRPRPAAPSYGSSRADGS